MQPSQWMKLAWIASVLVARPMAGQPTRTFTLEEAYRMAMDNYQVIGAMKERVEQAIETSHEARSLVLPTAYTQLALTHNFVSAELEFEGNRIRLLPPNDYNVALVVSQPVFSGMRNIKAKRQADIGIDVADKNYVATAQDALLEVTRAYYTVLAIQENVEITKRSVELSRETLRTAESLYQAGESVETAVLRARVAVTDAERELLEAENNLKIAKDHLALLNGHPGDFELTRPETPQPPTVPVEELIAAGLHDRAELQALGLQEEISELQIERQKGQYFPDIRLDGTYVRRYSTFPSPQLTSVAVNANWVLFDGFRRAAQVASARSRLREIELQRDLLQEVIGNQVRATYLTVETRRASVDMLEGQVEFARKNAESTQKAYRVGEATDLDILASNETLTRSERQFALATYQLELAVFELERAIGAFARDFVSSYTGGQP